VAFLDADDEWEPDVLRLAAAALDAAPSARLCRAGGRPCPGEGLARDRRMGLESGVWRAAPDEPPRRLKYCVDYSHSSCVVARRALVERYGGYYDADRCSYGEDSYLWLFFVLNHPLALDLGPHVWFHTEHSALGGARRADRSVPLCRPATAARALHRPTVRRCSPAGYYRPLETEKPAAGQARPEELSLAGPGTHGRPIRSPAMVCLFAGCFGAWSAAPSGLLAFRPVAAKAGDPGSNLGGRSKGFDEPVAGADLLRSKARLFVACRRWLTRSRLTVSSWPDIRRNRSASRSSPGPGGGRGRSERLVPAEIVRHEQRLPDASVWR
jgi:hypothetical protein